MNTVELMIEHLREHFPDNWIEMDEDSLVVDGTVVATVGEQLNEMGPDTKFMGLSARAELFAFVVDTVTFHLTGKRPYEL